jgi:aminoglycoside phosphotransferase (APT) family kinase protein
MAQAAGAETIQERCRRWAEHVLPEYVQQHPEELDGSRQRLCEKAIASWADLLIARTAGGAGVTMIHGDAHPGQVFFSRDPQSVDLVLLDWEEHKRGLGAYDLAYLFVLGHRPDYRRDVERDVLRLYHERLLAGGIEGYPWEQCLADYRLSVLACLFAPVGWKRGEFLDCAVQAFEDWGCGGLLR